MTPNQQREELSRAYVATVAAQCGYKLGTWSQDDDCVDLTIAAASVVGRGTVSSPKLDVQLKCSSDPTRDHDEYVTCQLSRKHHELLRAERMTPLVLVVVMLPEDENDWVTHTADQLVLRRCGYWTSLRTAGPFQGGAESVSVKLPKEQVFSPDTLQELMTRSNSGEVF